MRLNLQEKRCQLVLSLCSGRIMEEDLCKIKIRIKEGLGCLKKIYGAVCGGLVS
jgi:hypothetical protein